MIEDAVSQLRASLKRSRALNSPQASPETRLTLACLHSRGHLLVTGSDRSAIDAVVARVIDKLEPLAVANARAADPATGADDIYAIIAKGSMPKGYVERQRVLAELVHRAEVADKTVLVVVNDAEAATVEQLEHLRETLEVTPEALKYLRLVLIGNNALIAKLHTQSGRALSACIASHVRVDGTDAQSNDSDAAAPSRTPVVTASRSYALTLAAITCVGFCTGIYATVFLTSHDRRTPRTVDVASREFAIAAGAMETAEGVPADQPAGAAQVTPAFNVPAPKLAAPAAGDEKKPAPSVALAQPTNEVAAATAQTKPAPAEASASAATPAPANTAVAAKPARAKAATATTAKPATPRSSSISSFLKHFR